MFQRFVQIFDYIIGGVMRMRADGEICRLSGGPCMRGYADVGADACAGQTREPPALFSKPQDMIGGDIPRPGALTTAKLAAL